MHPGTVHDTPLVRIRGLCFRYPGSHHDLLRIPALEIAGSGLTALMGPAGMEKSTLVELLAGTLREPYEGSLEVLGIEWKGLTRDADRQRQLRRIGLIPQYHALLSGRTVGELLDQDLADVDIPRSEREARITRALRKAGLAGFFDRESNRLSGVERERVAIAHMLVRNVDLVIAEEPTTNLDRPLAWETISLLRKLAEHAPVIVVTRDTHTRGFREGTVVTSTHREAALAELDEGGALKHPLLGLRAAEPTSSEGVPTSYGRGMPSGFPLERVSTLRSD
jgi:ABC-type lipoprotein export system ATPase subunit